MLNTLCTLKCNVPEELSEQFCDDFVTQTGCYTKNDDSPLEFKHVSVLEGIAKEAYLD